MWTLKQVHRVGELSAAVAVVLSLLFVGYEVRQNNQTNIQTATQAVVSDHIATVRRLSEDAEMACIYARGVQDYQGMSGSERLRFSAWFLAVFYGLQEMHSIFEQGAMDPSIWSGFDSLAQEVTQLPGTRQWLATRRHWFSNEFQRYLDDITLQSLPADPIIYDDPACSMSNRG